MSWSLSHGSPQSAPHARCRAAGEVSLGHQDQRHATAQVEVRDAGQIRAKTRAWALRAGAVCCLIRSLPVCERPLVADVAGGRSSGMEGCRGSAGGRGRRGREGLCCSASAHLVYNILVLACPNAWKERARGSARRRAGASAEGTVPFPDVSLLDSLGVGVFLWVRVEVDVGR